MSTPTKRRGGLGARGRVVSAWLLGLVVAAWSLVLVAWLTLHWGILPHLDRWKPQIERRASQALGVPVEIGSIAARSGGWVPAFELRDVVLRDAAGQPALALPRIAAALSPRSLTALDVRFRQVLIEGAHLEVRRDAQGRFIVGGLALGGNASSADDGAGDWFFRQSEVVIRGGSLRWTDDLRHAPPLALADVQIVVRNGLRRHDLRLDATPPAEWGDRFRLDGRFTQPLLADAGDWRRWTGVLHADLPRADVSQLRRYLDTPVELTEGDGALRAWVDVAGGEARGATVDLALRAVRLRLGKDIEPLALQRIEGRLQGTRDEAGFTAAAHGFGFVTADGVRWPAGDATLTWRQPRGKPAAGGSLTAQRIDLALVSQIAARLPIGQDVRQELDALAPRGIVSGFSARWDGPPDAPDRYQAQGTVDGLVIAARDAAREPTNESARGTATGAATGAAKAAAGQTVEAAARPAGPSASEPVAIGRPGVSGAHVVFKATEQGGDATLAIVDGRIDLPGMLAEPQLPLDRLDATLKWHVERHAAREAGRSAISVQVSNARFSNADLQGSLVADWHSGSHGSAGSAGALDRYPGRLELTGQLTRGAAARIARYLPLGIGPSARDYVAHAIRGGRIASAGFHVRGDLRDFPFHRLRDPKDGEFRVVARLDDVDLDYVPGTGVDGGPSWPTLSKLSADLLLDRASMEIRNAQATSSNLMLSKVQLAIRSLTDKPVLVVDGTVDGALSDMLHFVDTSPIGAMTGQAFARAVASGPATLRLGLTVPLTAVRDTQVKGSLLLAGNDLRIVPDAPALDAAQAQVDFTEKGFSVTGGQARALGGDIAFDGASAADGSHRFTARGTASAAGLRQAPELGLAAQVAGSLTGQAAYRATLGIVRGHVELGVTSDLVGMASTLPAPFQKPADAPLALRLQTAMVPDALRDTFALDVGDLLQARYLRDVSGETTRIVHGGIGVRAPAPSPETGVAAHLDLATVDSDAWSAIADRWTAASAAPAPAASAVGLAAAPTVPAAIDPGDTSYVPTAITLRAHALLAHGRKLDDVLVGASREGDLWRANLDAAQLDGYVEYRLPRRGLPAGRVYARLSRLSLPKSDADDVDTLLDQRESTIPALDIVIDDVELRGKRLGKVEIEAVNRGIAPMRDTRDGREREWRLSRLAITLPEAKLTASGGWVSPGMSSAPTPAATDGKAGDAARRATLAFTLDIADSGALLQRLGSGGTIQGGKGKLEGEVSWLGSPLALDFATMSGHIALSMAAGQFLKTEPGAARLLSVLSLQSIPRRLALDFRDVFQQGFAFDSVVGDVAITRGVATTNNLRMRGLQAAVLMEGSADLEREVQDLRVVVVPEINAGTASLAYAVINPAIGLGTFLAQVVLRKPLIRASTREFRVTGPWADPKVERVERSLTAPVPDMNEPLPPPIAADSDIQRK